MSDKRETRGNGSAVRMRDVALRAGVSPMTVSRALRDPSKVSEEMRRRVDAAVAEVGYLPNRIAGSLSSNRSHVIGMIVPSIRNSLFANTIQGISDVLRSNGFHLMVADSGHSLEEEEALVAALLAQRVGGLVLHNTQHTARVRELIAKTGVPTIETGNLARKPIDSTVSYSNADAAKAMTMHLARLGYRKIGFVTLPTRDNDRSVERRKGYFAALEELGRPADPSLALEAPGGGFDSGAEALIRMMKAHPDLDAGFFAGDVLAVGALFECQRRGWAVPSRLAIASFDDLDLLRHVVPTVTTLRIPRYEIGRRAAEILLDRLRGATPHDRVVVDLGFEIIQREST